MGRPNIHGLRRPVCQAIAGLMELLFQSDTMVLLVVEVIPQLVYLIFGNGISILILGQQLPIIPVWGVPGLLHLLLMGKDMLV